MIALTMAACTVSEYRLDAAGDAGINPSGARPLPAKGGPSEKCRCFLHPEELALAQDFRNAKAAEITGGRVISAASGRLIPAHRKFRCCFLIRKKG